MAFKFDGWSPPTPYPYMGNRQLLGVGFGQLEKAFLGTGPGAPFGYEVDIAGMGGVSVKRDIKPVATSTYQAGGNGSAAEAPIGGLTGGLYQTGQNTLTALQQYVAQVAYNGQGPAPPGS